VIALLIQGTRHGARPAHPHGLTIGRVLDSSHR
jgi:hypothetical protein